MATKEQRQRKQFAEMLLRVKGLDYDDWLDEKHRAIIEENQDLMLRGLKVILENDTDTSSNTSNHTNVNVSSNEKTPEKTTTTSYSKME